MNPTSPKVRHIASLAIASLVCLLVWFGLREWSSRNLPSVHRSVDGGPQVLVLVDFGGGAEVPERHMVTLPAQATAFDALRLAFSDPSSIDSRGSGESLTVEGVRGVMNQGGGADKKNWLFWVNGTLADRGAGVYPVAPGDTVHWKFSLFPQELRSDGSEFE